MNIIKIELIHVTDEKNHFKNNTIHTYYTVDLAGVHHLRFNAISENTTQDTK